MGVTSLCDPHLLILNRLLALDLYPRLDLLPLCLLFLLMVDLLLTGHEGMRGRILGFQLAHSLVIDQPAWDRDLNKPDMDWLRYVTGDSTTGGST